MGRGDIVLIALLVTVAGCQSVLPGGMETDEANRATPRPVSVPGVTVHGVRDANRLALAHKNSLNQQSYTLRSTIVINRTHGDSMVMIRVLRVGDDHERFLFRQRVHGDIPFSGVNRPDRNLTAWSSGKKAYAVTVTEQGPQYTVTSPTIGWRMLHGQQALRKYFSRPEETHIVPVIYKGWAGYRIVANQSSSLPSANPRLRAVTIIDTFGVIFTLQITGPATDFDWIPGEGWVRIELRYEEIGDTTVSEPSWIGRAKNETEASISPVGDEATA